MKYESLAILLAIALAVVACDDRQETTTDSATSEATKTDAQQAEKPAMDELILAFQPQENPEGLELNSQKLAEFMQKETGIETKVFVPTSYAAVVEALRNDNAHVAYFSGWPYLIAHREAGAEVLLAEVRDGESHYFSQWYVAKDSDYQSLEDLKGKPVAFTSRTSTSGYLFPMAKVIEEGHLEKGQEPRQFFGEVLFAGGYEAALKSLVAGKVEAAAASDYAPGRYLSEEEQDKIRVLTKQGPAPTHLIAIKDSVPDDVKTKVKEALLKLNEPAHKELLKSIYGAEKLVEVTHEDHVDALSRAQELVDTDYPMKK